jgi:hypothetical protein
MQQKTKSFEVVDCHIELMYSQPTISRRVRVPVLIGLHHLHDIIQCVFSWTESHLHAFHISDEEYQNPDYIFDDGLGTKPKNEKRAKLTSIIENGVDNFIYVYDFGDNWEHSIQFGKGYSVNDPKEILRLLDGENAAPPEDCGGVPGYEDFIEIMSDPKHEEYENMQEWYDGSSFDPSHFDIKETAIRLENLRTYYSRYWNRFSA